jgi:hypothetical protein
LLRKKVIEGYLWAASIRFGHHGALWTLRRHSCVVKIKSS